MTGLYVDSIKDASNTKTLATLSSSAVTLHSDVTFPAGHVVNFVSGYSNTTGAGVSVAGSAGSANSHGVELFSLDFTPKFSDSKLLLQTSSIFMGEESNVGTYGWLNAWYDTTRLAMVYGTSHYGSFVSNMHWTVLSLNHTVNSWGTTEKAVKVRAGNNGAGYVKNRSTDDLETQEMSIQFSIMEIKQ